MDAFGHKALTGTARFLANTVARSLDTKTRCIELSTLQRCAGHLTSRTDITEAYQVGGAAAKAAFEGVTGQMVALKRISNNPYQCTTELHPISEVANLEKKVPLSWMNENHTQMTHEFLEYARPLIQARADPAVHCGPAPPHLYEVSLGGTHFCAQSRDRNSFPPNIPPGGQNLAPNRALGLAASHTPGAKFSCMCPARMHMSSGRDFFDSLTAPSAAQAYGWGSSFFFRALAVMYGSERADGGRAAGQLLSGEGA